MISGHLVMHSSGPFFTLNDEEYKEALKLYPELADDVDSVSYVEKTATGSIDVNYDSYFDNSTILTQFERFFKLLQMKSEFKNHNIEIIVDNATTHTAKPYSLSVFGKSIGTKCTAAFWFLVGLVSTVQSRPTFGRFMDHHSPRFSVFCRFFQFFHGHVRVRLDCLHPACSLTSSSSPPTDHAEH